MSRGVCTPRDRRKCRAESGKFLEWACTKCEKIRAENLHPYTVKMIRLMRLKQAGYPLRANDLSMEEWLDLQEVMQWQEMLANSTSRSV
ncbi:hypothetical protein [uncultured Pseudodesulfovibrio sp.]|uniref:hypothetical protein n=1 Tax=uncultured Pseudodesulfovibrio sp. TaxID=2035858 RepID=UPI0029C73188|nr:hypothetical protein [uncultured Pseudodesulfovibrio sp.]